MMTVTEKYNQIINRMKSDENREKWHNLNMNSEHTPNENKLLMALCKGQNALWELEPNTSPKPQTREDWEREANRWLRKIEECLQIDGWK